MPLYKTITVDSATKVLIWKIDESFEKLRQDIQLSSHCQNKLQAMKSDRHKRGFMSIRHLLHIAGYQDHDVTYDQDGKPHLNDEHYISITHSFQFSGIIISKRPVGIDIEKKREKILRIANRFTPLDEYRTLANNHAIIRKLSIVWGAKESIYKIMNIRGLSFLEHIYVDDFDFEDQKTKAVVYYDNINHKFALEFTEFEGFSCVYAQALDS